MDNRTRIALIALLIVVPLFVAVVLWGLLKHDSSRRGNDRKQTANSLTVPPVMHRIENLFPSLRPSLKLAQQTFRVPARSQIGPGRIGITVPATQHEREKFRNGRFRMLGNPALPSSSIEYQDFAAPLDKTYVDLASQSVEFPAPPGQAKRRSEDPNGMVGSIVVLKDGGKLTFVCQSAVPCTFELIR